MYTPSVAGSIFFCCYVVQWLNLGTYAKYFKRPLVGSACNTPDSQTSLLGSGIRRTQTASNHLKFPTLGPHSNLSLFSEINFTQLPPNPDSQSLFMVDFPKEESDLIFQFA